MQETERVVKSGDYLEIDGFHRYFGHAYAEGKNAKFPEPLVLCCSKKVKRRQSLVHIRMTYNESK
ncbi:MAG: hypothetical protein EB829_06550 [Nitrosopumilus sp. H8]|nr:MAG: hypothetical protein EB829_06550 [Nitrosopumilus sp. H8]